MNRIDCYIGDTPAGGSFDNVAVRTRGEACLVSGVAPPFQTVYWPDLSEASSSLGLAGLTAAALAAPDRQARFLARLAGAMGGALAPGRIGFGSPPEEVRAREAFRQGWQSVVFVGAVPRAVALAALEAVCGRVGRGATVDAKFSRMGRAGRLAGGTGAHLRCLQLPVPDPPARVGPGGVFGVAGDARQPVGVHL